MKKSHRLLTRIFLPPLLLGVAFCLLLGTESGFRFLVKLGDAVSGSLFSVEQVRGGLLSGWQLEEVQLHLPGVVQVEFEELACSWKPAALVDKELRVHRLEAKGLVVRLEAAEEKKKEAERLPITLPDIRLPLALAVEDLQLHDAALYFPGSLEPFPVHALLLRLSARDEQVQIVRLKVESRDYGGELQAKVRLSGAWPLELQGKWRVTDPAVRELRGAVRAAGDMEALTLSLELKSPASATVEGQLTDLLGDLQWKVSAKTAHLALKDLNVDLPIDGALTAVEASGTLNSYAGTLVADIHYEGYPEVQLRTEAEGDLKGLTVRSLQLLLDQAELATRGRIDWTEGLSWQAELEGWRLDPSPFASQWPGQIDARFHSQGKWSPGKLAAEVKIDHLQGELRGFPLTGSGRAALDGKTLIVNELDLRSGGTQLRVNGRANDQLDFLFLAGSDNLKSLIPDGSGLLQMEGRVHGSRQEPHLSMTLDASEVKVSDYALQRLAAVIDADLSHEGIIAADVQATGVDLPGKAIDKAQLKLEGSREAHRLELSGAGSFGTLQLALAGGMQEGGWRGDLSRLLLRSNQYGEWQSEQGVPLQLAKKKCELSQLTLLQDQVRISLGGKWEEQGGWQLRGEVDDFSLQLLEEWGLVAQQLAGTLTASVTAAGEGAALAQAKVVAGVPELSLTGVDEEGESETWQWSNNELQAELRDGALRITANSRFQDGSMAELAADVGNCGDFSKPEEMTLDGALVLNVKDLSPLAPLSDYLVTATGQLAGSCTLQGTVARPAIQAELALRDGRLQVPDAGIEVEKVKLTVNGDGTTNRVGVTLASGEGRLEVKGVVGQSRQGQLQADLAVKGQNFPAVDLLEYTAVISPDLHFVYGEKGAALQGTVVVPKAHIAPVGFHGSVSSSRDVVLVDANGEEEKGALPLSLDLAVVLGDEVEVDAFGLRGGLGGRLKITQNPGQAITGLGSLKFHDGTFSFRGTSLEIERGLVFYQGGSIEDPGLDVRARKKVYEKTVGVQVTGSVSRMEMNLFSDPPMDESDTLAYLLVGHDMSASNEKEGSMLSAVAATLGGGTGIGFLDDIEESTGLNVNLTGGVKASDFSLVVGKEIYEDLYISYGKGLKDPAGTFQARYDLKYGFSIKTEATSEATGADLLWSLER